MVKSLHAASGSLSGSDMQKAIAKPGRRPTPQLAQFGLAMPRSAEFSGHETADLEFKPSRGAP